MSKPTLPGTQPRVKILAPLAGRLRFVGCRRPGLAPWAKSLPPSGLGMSSLPARGALCSSPLPRVAVITKELLKTEIDIVPKENPGVLYKIIKALEEPALATE